MTHEKCPAGFAEWWAIASGQRDAFTTEVAWNAVRHFIAEVNGRAEAQMIVQGVEQHHGHGAHQAHGAAILHILQRFHSSPESWQTTLVDNPVNKATDAT